MKKNISLILGGISGFVIGWFSFPGGFLYNYMRPLAYVFFDVPGYILTSLFFKLGPESTKDNFLLLFAGIKSTDVMLWAAIGVITIFIFDILLGILIVWFFWKILNNKS